MRQGDEPTWCPCRCSSYHCTLAGPRMEVPIAPPSFSNLQRPLRWGHRVGRVLVILCSPSLRCGGVDPPADLFSLEPSGWLPSTQVGRASFEYEHTNSLIPRFGMLDLHVGSKYPTRAKICMFLLPRYGMLD